MKDVNAWSYGIAGCAIAGEAECWSLAKEGGGSSAAHGRGDGMLGLEEEQEDKKLGWARSLSMEAC